MEHEGGEALFALPQGVFNLLALRDVMDDRIEQLAAFDGQGTGEDLDVPDPSIGQLMLEE